jgi:anaerobic magnesium-protoporphyrin IX monomethyl ester cyclase
LKFLFIIPNINFEDRYNSSSRIRNIGFLPLGIAKLAAMLEKKGHEVKVLDLTITNDSSMKETYKIIKNYDPDFIGMQSLILSSHKIFRIADFIKKHFDIPIILGGPYATIFSRKILKEHKSIDIIVLGEGDYTLCEILDSYKNKKDLKKIKGIIFRDKNQKIIKTKNRPLIKNLDELPYAAIHIFELDKYLPLPNQYKRFPVVNMITSRGCQWGRCTYCFQLFDYFRRMSPRRVVDEIKYLKNRFGIKEIAFFDEIFVFDKKWIMEFCDLLQKANLDIIWSCNCIVNRVDEEILKKMAQAGCWNILYGIESGNQETLNRIKKGITLEQARNAVNLAKKQGIEVRVSFMLGFPWETPEMTDKTIKFASELGADFTQFCITTPYPGTNLYKECSNSKSLDKDFRNYCDSKVVFLPKGYKNKKELERKYKRAYIKCYFTPKFIFRSLKNIKSLEDLKRYFNGLKFLISIS